MKECGRTATSFVVDSLSRVFTSISTGLKADTQSRLLWVSFPEDCRKLMHVAKIDPPVDANATRTGSNEASTVSGMVMTSMRSVTSAVPGSTMGSRAFTQVSTGMMTGTMGTSGTTAKSNGLRGRLCRMHKMLSLQVYPSPQ